jgi:hypothetical protein
MRMPTTISHRVSWMPPWINRNLRPNLHSSKMQFCGQTQHSHGLVLQLAASGLHLAILYYGDTPLEHSHAVAR